MNIMQLTRRVAVFCFLALLAGCGGVAPTNSNDGVDPDSDILRAYGGDEGTTIGAALRKNRKQEQIVSVTNTYGQHQLKFLIFCPSSMLTLLPASLLRVMEHHKAAVLHTAQLFSLTTPPLTPAH